MSEKAIIVVPFLTGYFLMRTVALIVLFREDDFNSIDGNDYLFISIASVVLGITFVYVYLLLKYFGII